MSPRRILHLDLDAFFCSVEEIKNPELRGKAFMVGGQADSRGVVASCSYAARKKGISSAMPTSRASRLCPELIIVSGHYEEYSKYSHQVMDIMARHSGLMEIVSVDEAFLDISDIGEPGLSFAKKLQTEIFQETHLPCSIGLGSSKLIAKIATDAGKSAHHGSGPPMAILEVKFGTEAEFLAPMPVRAMWGVGPKTAERLNSLGLHTIGDLAREPEVNLIRIFGSYGADLARHARGIDDRPVSNERETKSISQEITFAKDVDDEKKLLLKINEMSEHVGSKLRKENLTAMTVRLKIRWPDFSTHTRQVTLRQPTNQDSQIQQAAEQLFLKIWNHGKPVRLIGIGVSGLAQDMHQLTLWDTPSEKERRLLHALDELKERYGKTAVQKGTSIHAKGKNEIRS